MEPLEAINKLQSSDEFTSWKKENPDAYLCHCMKMMEDKDAWHIGYSDKENNITSFIIKEGEVKKDVTDKAFSKDQKEIKKLELEKINIDSKEALSKAIGFCSMNYPNEPLSKNFILLQNIDLGQIYNITFITLTLSTINVKVSSENGNILEHKKTSLMDLKDPNYS